MNNPKEAIERAIDALPAAIDRLIPNFKKGFWREFTRRKCNPHSKPVYFGKVARCSRCGAILGERQ